LTSGEVELVQPFADRERGDAHSGAGIGLLPGGDLRVDEGAEELLR
jgi:hypothetical protein